MVSFNQGDVVYHRDAVSGIRFYIVTLATEHMMVATPLITVELQPILNTQGGVWEMTFRYRPGFALKNARSYRWNSSNAAQERGSFAHYGNPFKRFEPGSHCVEFTVKLR